MPRDVDPQVRIVRGCFLHDMDDLERAIPKKMREGHVAEVEAGKIVEEETHDFRRKLAAEHSGAHGRCICVLTWKRSAARNCDR